jgi:CheY-like chemotaxis protein
MPLGLISVDQSASVVSLNRSATSLLRLEPGIQLKHIVHPDDVDVFESLLLADLGEHAETQMRPVEDSVYTRVTVLSRNEDVTTLAIEDISELMALGSQLKNARQPERKFIHELSNALATTIGYTELIKMMLEEHDELSGERLAAIRRYEAEVFEGLKRADELIRARRQSASQQVSAAVPLQRKHVVVVDDEPQITEFLSELLRARHYKVTTFTSGIDALEFYKERHQEVDLVIMDQVMPEMSGISLATELLAIDLDQPIVLCTGDQNVIQDQSAGKLHIEHFLSKPIDINELSEMVSNIVGQ